MPVPEIPAEGTSLVQQLGTGIVVGVAALGWVVQQFFKGRSESKKEEPKPVILERAELADMEPVRKMVAQWGEVCEKLDDIIEAKADIEETRRATAEMKLIIEKLARKAEIDEEVTRRLRDEEMRQNRGKQPGDRRT